MQTIFINTPEALTEYVAGLQTRNNPVLAIDTEFERRNTYFATPCLIQISDGEIVGLIDVITIQDLSPLKPILSSPALKIFHAGDQDLQVFAQLFNELPLPYFDTQLAAAFLGMGEQIGYDKLIEQTLNIALQKTSQYSDWTKRPLTEKQLAYAADDVIYLHQAYTLLQTQLAEKGRTDWLKPLLEERSNLTHYQPNPETAWQRIRIKGSDAKFRGRIKALAIWREQQAIQQNKPRQRLFDDTQLMKHAASPKQAPAEMRDIMKNATPLPTPPRPENPKHGAALPLLRLLLSHCCRTHQIAERLVATSDDLIAIARDGVHAETEALAGWRNDIFGREALDLLGGKIGASYDPASFEIVLSENI